MRTERMKKPENGCAKCAWWLKNPSDNYGQCRALHMPTWWQHAACPEYEREFPVDEEISIYVDGFGHVVE